MATHPIQLRALWPAFVFQAFGVLSIFTMDGGRTLFELEMASAAFWLSAGLLFLRRPRDLTGADVAFIQFAFPILCVIFFYTLETLRPT